MPLNATHRSLFNLALLLGTLLRVAVGFTCDLGAEVCDDAEAKLAELESPTRELYLLQKRAQVVRKSEGLGKSDSAAGTISRSTSSSSATSALAGLVEVNSSATGAASSESLSANDKRSSLESSSEMVARKAIPLGKSRSVSAVFIASANNKIVPLSHMQRLSMLSTSEASQLSEFGHWVMVVACSVVLFLIGGGAIFINMLESIYARIIREMLSLGLDFVATHVLGVDITFTSMDVMVLQGVVRITDITIANPPNFKSAYFMNASIMEVRLNLRSLVSSHFFRKRTNLDLAAIMFKDVTLNVEESETSSNAHEIKAILNGSMPKPQRRKAKAGQGRVGPAPISLRKLMIADIGASVPTLGRIAPILHYKDLGKGSASKATRMRPMVSQILANVVAEATM